MRAPVFLAPLVCLVCGLPAGAALDVEGKTPYRLRVVLRCGDHPDLTAGFRAELRRDLLSGLQAALGPLGTVEVFDLGEVPPERWEPLWKAFAEKGFTALDGQNGVTGVKTHFVRVDLADGQYELRARQCDGVAGFITPLVRHTRTHARRFVPRLALLAVHQDFGIVGTAEPAGRDAVAVKLKAGALGVPMDRWVTKGDVFALVQVRPAPRRRADAAKGPAGPKEVGARVDGALLQATEDPQGGLVPCRLFNRYDDPLVLRGSALGFRCVKLGTTAAPLRLRLEDGEGLPHKAGTLQVRVHTEHFPDRPGEGEDVPARNGVFETREPLPGLALVQVSVAGRDVARIPVEILNDDVAVRRVKVESGAEARGRLDQSRRDLISRITDARLTQVRCFRDLIELEGAGKNKEALDRAEAARKTAAAEEAELRQDVERLAARAQRELPGVAGFTADCEQQLQLLRDKQAELVKHVAKLQEAIRIENDPTVQAKRKAVEAQIRQAELLVQQSEYDQALAAFDEALKGIDDEKARALVQARRDALAKAWALKDAEHGAARKFVYDRWPALPEAREIKEALPEARKAFEKCKSVGDRLTLGKLVLAAPELVNRIEAQLKQVQDSTEEEDQRAVAALKKVGEELEQFLKDVTAYLKASEKKPKE